LLYYTRCININPYIQTEQTTNLNEDYITNLPAPELKKILTAANIDILDCVEKKI